MSQSIATAGTSVSTPRLYRTAGRAAIVAGVAYLVQPIIVFLLDPAAGIAYDENDPSAFYPNPVDALTTWYLGSIQAIEFTVIAVASLLLVLSVGTITRRSLGEAGPWAQATHVLGLIASVGWLLTAGAAFASHLLVAYSLTDFQVDAETQKLALQAATLGMAPAIALVMVGTGGWMLGLAVTGRRAGLIPAALRVIAVIVGVALLANVLINPTGVPTFGLVVIPAWIALGCVLLVRGRRAARESQ